jgi:2-methylcitrate dehydratase PrpD
MFKPYPCGVVLNPVIDACLVARAKPNFSANRIVEVIVSGAPLLKARADRPEVSTGREAQVSAQHAVAVSLLRGHAGAEEFSDAVVNDPQVKALRAKVRPVEIDAGTPVEAAHVSIRYTDGSSVVMSEKVATGSLARPMSDPALREKFAALARYGCPTLAVDSLADALWTLADQKSVGDLMTLARPRSEVKRA